MRTVIKPVPWIRAQAYTFNARNQASMCIGLTKETDLILLLREAVVTRHTSTSVKLGHSLNVSSVQLAL